MTLLRHGIFTLFIGVLLCLGIAGTSSALAVAPKPTDVPVVDQTNTLTPEQITALAQQIKAERDNSGNQIAVLMIPSLEGEVMEDYSLKVAREWGIGTKENNNGVLFLVAKNDRRFRIEVGTGLEGALTDVQSSRILRNEVAPNFRAGKYFEGLQAGLGGIIAAIHGEYTASTQAEQAPARFPWEIALGFAFMGISWLGSILARTKSWWAGGILGGLAGGAVGVFASSLVFGIGAALILAVIGLLFDRTISRNYQKHVQRGDTPSWWAGGGVIGGGPDGGFGGFGGGSFGGGGASGDW